MTPRPGKLPSLGDHEVVRLIAKGGMGSVFEVRSRTTGATYAAKTIHRPDDQRARERFRREAELLARVDRHPGIVRIHAFGETDGGLYLILDLVDGESLEALLEREQRLEPQRAAEIARAIAAALGHAHSVGIIHRDVKPANVLMDRDGQSRLTDFGLAVARDLERLTRTGAFVGTVSYCAPEQALGGTTGPWSDVFSLGCVLFHMLTGTTPIDVDTNVGIMARLADREPLVDVRTRVPEVPASLAAIVARAIAKDPTERYADGSEVASDLERFLSGGKVTFVPASRTRRKGMLLLALVVLASAVLSTVAGVLLLGRRERTRRALAAARDELARARSLGARPNATAGELAEAREHLGRATAEGESATRLGADRDEPLELAVAALRLDLAGAEANAALARGDAAAALALVDELPGAPATLGDPAHCVRARALVALGRAGEAIHEVEGLKGSEPLEILGDVRMLEGRPAEAEEAYGRGFAAGGPDARRLRARRGGAAALAGDVRTADADLVALLGDPLALPTDRAAIATVASLAPALYRRGLAAELPKARTRDLEAAWKLGRPPPALVSPVVRTWLEEAATAAEAWVHRGFAKRVSDPDVAELEAILALAGRAHALEPDTHSQPLDNNITYAVGMLVPEPPTPRIEAYTRRLLASDPEEPRLLYALAWAARGTPSKTRREPFECISRSLSALLARPHDDADQRIYSDGVIVALELAEEDPSLPIDLALLQRAAETGGLQEAWSALAEYHAHNDATLDAAFECLARAAPLPKRSANETPPGEFNGRRVTMLLRHGRLDEAIAEARAYHESNPSSEDGEQTLVDALAEAGRSEELLRVVSPSYPHPETVTRALLSLGRTAEARALVAKLRERGEPRTAECESVIDASEGDRIVCELLAAGKQDEALEAARKLVQAGGHARAWRLTWLLNRCGRPGEVVTLVPPDEPLWDQLLERGLALVKLGDAKAARAAAARLRKMGRILPARQVEAALALAATGEAR